MHIAAYIAALRKSFQKPTVKQHLTVIRMLFDWQVTGGILATNPASAVRSPKHAVERGKTPVLTSDQDPHPDREHRHVDAGRCQSADAMFTNANTLRPPGNYQ